MMSEAYAAVYEDARGRESTVIHNDGRLLRLNLRGIDFEGRDFDGLSPAHGSSEDASLLFTLQHGDLCACKLEWSMPLRLEHDGVEVPGVLSVTLELGEPLPNGRTSAEILSLSLHSLAGSASSSGLTGWFEDELLEIVGALGDSVRVRACITCAFSDYHPAGHGLFGGLACFRDAKQEYSEARGKRGILAVWDRRTEFVQETYLCEQYSPRLPGTGYRG
jgi:hypothetical protein